MPISMELFCTSSSVGARLSALTCASEGSVGWYFSSLPSSFVSSAVDLLSKCCYPATLVFRLHARNCRVVLWLLLLGKRDSLKLEAQTWLVATLGDLSWWTGFPGGFLLDGKPQSLGYILVRVEQFCSWIYVSFLTIECQANHKSHNLSPIFSQ